MTNLDHLWYFYDGEFGWVLGVTRWIRGLRTTHFFQVTDSSRKRLHDLNLKWAYRKMGRTWYAGDGRAEDYENTGGHKH